MILKIKVKALFFSALMILFLAGSLSAKTDVPATDENAPGESLITENVEHVRAPTQKLYLGAETDFASRHIWRGLYWTSGATWMPSAWLSMYGVTATAWGRMPMENQKYQGNFNCIVLIFDYARDIGHLNVKPGTIIYFYPHVPNWSTTAEGFLNLAYSIGDFKIFTDQYFDYLDYKRSYFGDFGVGYNHSFSKVFNFTSSISTGWGTAKFNNVYAGLNNAALDYVSFQVGLESHVNKYIYVKPYLNYTVQVDGPLRRLTGEPNLFAVGVSIGVHN